MSLKTRVKKLEALRVEKRFVFLDLTKYPQDMPGKEIWKRHMAECPEDTGPAHVVAFIGWHGERKNQAQELRGAYGQS
jgi:hypothetical protein